MAKAFTANRGGVCSPSSSTSVEPRKLPGRTKSPKAFSGGTCYTRASPQKPSRSTTSQAAPLASRSLSTYNWPRGRPAVLDWLEQSIQYAVQKLDKAPFLELVYPDKHDTHYSIHPVTEAVVNSPQLWRGIAEHLSSSQPEIVILLHQLPPLKEDRKGGINTGQWASQQDKMFTGMASHEALNQSRLKYCSMLLRDGIAEGVLAGKVGDCCEGDVRNQIVPFSRQQHSQTNWDQHHHGSDSGEQLVDFWGLVVQSKVRSDAEGAYVLKTVRNSNPVGCQCTHYSLMRVCKGDLVKTHMSSAWLLNR